MKKSAMKGWRNILMNLLIDTNIIVDYLADREPFADQAEHIIEICNRGQAIGYLTASAVTDIYYILRKIAKHEQIIENLKMLFSILDITNVDKTDLLRAMDIDIPDLEDALVCQCAKKVKADFVVTRNIKDFRKSPIQPITPEDLLNQFFPK